MSIILLTLTPSPAHSDVSVGEFSKGQINQWEGKTFHKKTLYTLVEEETGTVLRASSDGTASGLFREIEIDLRSSPCLTWSWKVDQVLAGLDETTKAGDDYPARIYVIFSDGFFWWQTRALNYVWSNGQSKLTSWPNAYTEKSVNIAVQQGNKNTGQWVQQSRNIREDFKTIFGDDKTSIEAVAIMTDTDNSNRKATAYYGDISFTNGC